MLKRFLNATICGLLLIALANLGLAQGNSQGKGKGHNKQADQDDDRGDRHGVRIVFSVRDRDVIRGYYCRSAWPDPGAGSSYGPDLPPGLQKHLERDGTLPPGLQKRVQPFPEDLERRLPRLPDTYQRVTLGVDILILDRRTQRIVDIVHDILRP